MPPTLRIGGSWRIEDTEEIIESSLWKMGKRTDKNSVVFLGSVSCPVEDADHEHDENTLPCCVVCDDTQQALRTVGFTEKSQVAAMRGIEESN